MIPDKRSNFGKMKKYENDIQSTTSELYEGFLSPSVDRQFVSSNVNREDVTCILFTRIGNYSF